MTTAEFWTMIQRSGRGADGDADDQVERLVQALARMPTKEIRSFEKHAVKMFAAAYRADLWNAASLALVDGCGDDAFANFIGWLILQGKSAYTAVLADPDNLADHGNPQDNMESEGFLGIPRRAYEEKTGKDDFAPSSWPDQLDGELVDDPEVLRKKFPRIHRRFVAPQEEKSSTPQVKNASDWENCDDLLTLWTCAAKRFAKDPGYLRKRRLFACGCCRLIWQWVTDPRSRKVVEVGEKFADGECGAEALHPAWLDAHDAFEEYCNSDSRVEGPAGSTLYHPLAACYPVAYTDVVQQLGSSPDTRVFGVALSVAKLDATGPLEVLRDVFGNPSRPPQFEPSWRTKAVAKLADRIYRDRAFDRFPELEALLKQAGCTDETILEHCRRAIHARGCWLLDLLRSAK